jgi:hypothetical protein
MEAKEYRTIDKSSWPMRGEWDSEPDKAQWQDEDTGLPCLIVRGPSGALCGYVGLAEGHPLYGKDYEAANVEVHGGLTFADKCADSADEARHVCHVPGPGEPDHVWWFGFDCAHSGDVSPAYDRMFREHYSSYKTLAYVKHQVKMLAAQLHGSQADGTCDDK